MGGKELCCEDFRLIRRCFKHWLAACANLRSKHVITPACAATAAGLQRQQLFTPSQCLLEPAVYVALAR